MTSALAPSRPGAALVSASRVLRTHFGHQAFRAAQRPVIASILAGRDTLAVLPTGGGKSVCFQVPAMVLGGLTIVVSPLISLMEDQVSAAQARGVPAFALHSALRPAERKRVEAGVAAGNQMLLYLSPERLKSSVDWLAGLGCRPSLLAVDEAHCVSEWGHDFRPAYRRLGAVRRRLGRPPTIALTGSATPEVRADIISVLGGPASRWAVTLGSFDRRNLWFGVQRVSSEPARLAALLRLLEGDDRVAIVYAPTRSVTEAITRKLRLSGIGAAAYHAGLCAAERRRVLTAFLEDELEVVVATCAFGMGIDKPTVRLVVHWTMPPTPEAYYQEAGRAGRDGRPARCVLLYRPGDPELHLRQLAVTFPKPELLERLWAGGSTTGIPRSVLESAERLRHELHPERGPVTWTAVARRRKAAEGRIQSVRAYAEGKGCRRAAVLAYFGERLVECAGCDRCRTDPPLRALPRDVHLRAVSLRRALARGAARHLLDGPTLVRLAAHPPASAAALAEVAGVGPVVAARFGATILAALGVIPEPRPATPDGGPAGNALRDRLGAWRTRLAASAGLPDFLVLADRVLDQLAESRPTTRSELARLGVLGPRILATHGTELLALIAESAGESPAAGVTSG